MNARVVLYGHDTMGLGHLRRNLALAAALRGAQRPPLVLLVTGAVEVGRFPLPDGVDVLVLPAVTKQPDGGYRGRRLGVPLAELVGLRRGILSAALTSFAPHLLVVDKVARGLCGELEEALPRLRGAGTRVVLGLRDVLDGSAAAAAEWQRSATTRVLRAYYDEVWVYGDRRVSDVGVDCRMPPPVRSLLRYTGFLADGRPAGTAEPPPVAEGTTFVLGLLGGGQDGAELARAFAAAPRPAGTHAVLLTGPYLPTDSVAAIRAAAAGDAGLHVVDFCPDPVAWARRSAAVVCMGGYNTVTELLATDTPALVVPRVRPRTEQLVRARRLSALGLVDALHPDDLGPRELGHWIAAAAGGRVHRAGIVALDGLERVRRLAEIQLAQVRHAA